MLQTACVFAQEEKVKV